MIQERFSVLSYKKSKSRQAESLAGFAFGLGGVPYGLPERLELHWGLVHAVAFSKRRGYCKVRRIKPQVRTGWLSNSSNLGTSILQASLGHRESFES